MYNILIIGIETCRKDALQCYNPTTNTSHIQEFANKSLIFDNYFVTANNTYQSWGCTFSGKYAYKTGIATSPTKKMDVKLMDQIFMNNGYYVKWGNFNVYNLFGSEIEYSKSIGEFREPFFVFETGIDGHSPYGLTEKKFRSSDSRQLKDDHKRYIASHDTIFRGHIEKYSKYLDDTIVILMADHGDKITYGDAQHANNVDNETVNIPFILYHPKIKPRRINDLFTSIDIFPTLLGFCGIDYKDKFDGMDLSPYLLNNLPFPDRTVQIGPCAGCKDIRQISQGYSGYSPNQQYEYSRKEVLMRYKDYRNRNYVNNLFDELEKKNYFADEWTRRSEVYNNLEYAQHTPYVDKIIEKLDLRDNLKIVDAGAGTGMITKAILDKTDNVNKNIEIYAVDQSYAMLSKCPNNVAIKKFVADVGHLMFIPDNSVDRIVCSMMLHSEFESTDIIIREFHRILKKGGILILAEGIPMDDSLLEFYKSFLLKKEKREIFTKQKLVDMLDTNFGNIGDIDLSEVVLKSQSIKNWLYNSCTEEKLTKEIMDIHINANQETKGKMAMIFKDNDILCDWKYVIVKCTK